MVADKRPLHPLITQVMLRLDHTDIGLALWDGLAIELSSIIGVRGLESLYSRCLRQTNALYPWLTPHQPQAIGVALALLGSDLATRDVSEAREANAALMGILIDTLILLIGEPLTTKILHQCWGVDVVNHAVTEHQ